MINKDTVEGGLVTRVEVDAANTFHHVSDANVAFPFGGGSQIRATRWVFLVIIVWNDAPIHDTEVNKIQVADGPRFWEEAICNINVHIHVVIERCDV